MKAPSLEEVEQMSDDEVIDIESKLIEETNNTPRPADGFQPPQDEPSVTDGVD